MKRRVYILLLLCQFALLISAQGFWRAHEYVSLSQVDDVTRYVELVPYKSIQIGGVRHVRSNGYIVNMDLHETVAYTSQLYRTDKCDSLFVLPKILVSFAQKADSAKLLAPLRPLIKTIVDREDYLAIELGVASSAQVLQIVSELSSSKGVAWCEPDLLQRRVLHNPLFEGQYYLCNTGQGGGTPGMDINVVPAWDMVGGSPNITVAVIDTGCDTSHPDLAANMLSGYTVGGFAGNGTPVNVNSSKKAHGTACAGIVGAINNNIGVRGVASGVKILPVNIFTEPITDEPNDYGYLSDDETAAAIRWAASRADVISCSWGGGDVSTPINNAITSAVTTGRNGKGTVVICSAGNGGNNLSVTYPANLPTTLSVGAIDKNGMLAYYSQTGSSLDVVAFGGLYPGDICTTDISGAGGSNAGDYMYDFNGTSAACPQVAGVAALMLSANPDLTSSRVKEIIKNTARDLGTAGRDDWYGYGLVDAAQAIAVALGDKMRLAGADIVAGAETYTISDLPAGCAVQWSFRSNGRVSYVPSLSPLAQGSVSVRNTAHVAFGGDLVATVCFPDSTISPYIISRTITGDGPLTGLYREATSSYDCPLVDDEYDTNTATPGRMVTMTSNNFSHRNVSYSSPRGSHNCIETDGRVQFEMPQLAEGETADFTVSGGGVPSVLHFKFEAPYSCYNASRRVVKTLQGQTLRVRASGGESDAQVNGMIDNPKY